MKLAWITQGIDDPISDERYDTLYQWYPKTLKERTPTPRLLLAQTEVGDPADSGEVPFPLLEALEQRVFF